MPATITLYQFSLGLHAVFAVTFIGVAGVNSVIGPMARANPQHALFALKTSDRANTMLVIPGIAGITVTGIYQWIARPWDFATPWLLVSVGIFVVVVLLGQFLLRSNARTAIGELEAQSEPGPPSEQFRAAVATNAKIGPYMPLAVIILTFLMAAQPS